MMDLRFRTRRQEQGRRKPQIALQIVSRANDLGQISSYKTHSATHGHRTQTGRSPSIFSLSESSINTRHARRQGGLTDLVSMMVVVMLNAEIRNIAVA